MSKQARDIVKELKETAGNRKVMEADILDRLEKMCDPDQDEGDWISRYDIVEAGDALKLQDTGSVGKCKSECRTVARACEQLHEDIDLTDLSAMLFNGQKRNTVFNWMCYDSTDACSKKAPPVPKGRKRGEAHEAISEDELRAIKMMRNMKGSGLSGTLYDRDTMAQELAEMNDQYGDDPDFAKVFAEHGLNEHLPGAGDAYGDDDMGVEDGSAAGGPPLVEGPLTETVKKAASAVKEGASKLVEGVSEFASKMYNKVTGKGDAKESGEL